MASKVISMEKVYYSPKGYFMGKSAIDKLANSAKVTQSCQRLVSSTGNMADLPTWSRIDQLWFV